MKNDFIVTESTFEPPRRIEWEGVPVITTVQLAEFYDCKVIRIQQNFNENKDKFIEGKHYYKLEGEKLEKFKRDLLVKNEVVNNLSDYFQISLRTPSLYLWTKRGAARHAKILTTENAWKVFELLEDNYFDAKEKKAAESSAPSDDNFTVKEKADYLLKLAKVSPSKEQKIKLVNEAAKLLGVEVEDIIDCNLFKTRRNKNAKLTDEQAAEIRRLYATGNYTQSELAYNFGVTRTSVRRVINNMTYR